MKEDFIKYIKKEFSFNDEQIEEFKNSLEKPLKKSIRVNTNKISIEDFKKRAEKNKWILEATKLWKNTFYIDRQNSKEAPLWNTPEHLSGYFYIQEISASSSPFYMSNDKKDETPYLILDMSASPGWKTTQLSEYYPQSLIVANEIQKKRIPWLFSNIDRMSSLNVVVSNHDGRFFKNTTELFDKVLIDAPCSWEWTAFREENILKYRNIKNIKTISKLQFWLLECWIKALKPKWELVYSTCTLNKIENEQVIEKLFKKYWEFIELLPLDEKSTPWNKHFKTLQKNSNLNDFFKRSWPHLELAGGFFVAKIKKIKSIEFKTQTSSNQKNKWDKKQEIFLRQNIKKVSSADLKLIKKFFLENFDFDIKKYFIYSYNWEIHMCNKSLSDIWEKIFIYKIWINIGYIKSWEFTPSQYAGMFSHFKKNTLKIDKIKLDKLLAWQEIEYKKIDLKSSNKKDYYQLIYDDLKIGIATLKNSKLKIIKH